MIYDKLPVIKSHGLFFFFLLSALSTVIEKTGQMAVGCSSGNGGEGAQGFPHQQKWVWDPDNRMSSGKKAK